MFEIRNYPYFNFDRLETTLARFGPVQSLTYILKYRPISVFVTDSYMYILVSLESVSLFSTSVHLGSGLDSIIIIQFDLWIVYGSSRDSRKRIQCRKIPYRRLTKMELRNESDYCRNWVRDSSLSPRFALGVTGKLQKRERGP